MPDQQFTLRLSRTILDQMEPAIEDAVRNESQQTPDPSDGIYLKAHRAKVTKTGILIAATFSELQELKDRAEYDIETILENLQWESDRPYWRGRLNAQRALLKQIQRVTGAQQTP